MVRGPTLILALAACLAAAPLAQVSAQSGGGDGALPPTNVLILVADDLGVDMLGPYGEGTDLPVTPVIDDLAASGVLFRNAYASQACSPTRASLLTGRYPFRNGIGDVIFQDDHLELPFSEVILPEMLDVGTGGTWEHAAFGKWHVSSELLSGLGAPNNHGWSHFAGTLMNTDTEGDGYYDWRRVENGVAATSNTYATTATVDDALAWLGTASEPWMAYVSFHAPHTPLDEPPSSLYTTDPLTSPHGLLRGVYKAMIEAMDTEMGRLLDSLDPDVADRTTVIFLGDNGSPQFVTVPPFVPGHAKGTLYDGGVNVPLIVSGPLVDESASGGSESDAFVHVVDVFATVAEFAEVDTAASLPGVDIDGISLVPYLVDPAATSLRSHAFSEGFCPNYPGAELPTFLCQLDLGSGGPGDAALSLCGQPLVEGNTATLLLDAAAPSSLAFLAVSVDIGGLAFGGGNVVPFPYVSLIPLITDPTGSISLPVPGGVGYPLKVYLQYVIEDASQPFGYEISNAVSAFFHNPFGLGRVVRNDRYKLHKLVNTTLAETTLWELYDLQLDPFEQNDLLGAGVPSLTPEQAAALSELRNAMGDIVGP